MPETPQPDQNHLFPEDPNKAGHLPSGYVPMNAPESEPVATVPTSPVQAYRPPVPTTPPMPYGSVQPPVPVVPQQVQNPAYNPYATAPAPYPTATFDPNVPNNGYGVPGQPLANNYFQVVGAEGMPPNGAPQDPKKPNSFNDKMKKLGVFLVAKWWIVLLLVIGIGVMSVAIYSQLNQPKAPSGPFNNVDAQIEAAQSSPSGSPTRWKVTIRNRESVALQNVLVKLNLDRAFRYTSSIPSASTPDGSEYQIARLDPFNQGSSDQVIQIEGTLIGNIDEETLLSGTVTYTPSVLLSSANNRRTVQILPARTKITQPQIKLTLLATEENVQNGAQAELTLLYQNTSEQELSDLRIEMIYPDRNGFNYNSSELQESNTSEIRTRPDSSNNIWLIPRLPRLREQSLKVRGNVFGADGIKVTFGVRIGLKTAGNDYVVVATTSKDVTISAQPLLVTTRIESKGATKTFAPGETLTFVIDYQNNGTATLKDVEILGFVDDAANILDYSTVSFTGGDRGSVNNRTIQWRPANVPQLLNLSPKAKGQLRYSIRTSEADLFIKSNLAQNTYTLVPKASARATNLPQIEFAGDLYKGRGQLQFTQEIKSKGVDPTNRNKETFTVTWTLKSRQTQINDVKLTTTSPLRITAWQPASILPEASSSQISYSPSNGEIVWNPGKIPAFSGFNTIPPVTISFDLVVEVENGETNRNVTLFEASKIVGIDDYTGESYDLNGTVGKT